MFSIFIAPYFLEKKTIKVNIGSEFSIFSDLGRGFWHIPKSRSLPYLDIIGL